LVREHDFPQFLEFASATLVLDPMNVVQIHKFFYPHAGSETVLFHTRKLLMDRGHEVHDFAMEHPRNVPSPDAWAFAPFRDYNDRERARRTRGLDAIATVYSPAARRRLGRLLDTITPDVAHLHLISHQLTFSVVDELRRRRIPIVMTLHDYKIACPAYVMYRDGQRCQDCIGGAVSNAVRHRCLKGSTAGSLIAAAEAKLAVARHSWDDVDVFVTPSAFAGQVAVNTGVPAARVVPIQNFLPDAEVTSAAPPNGEGTPRFFIASRLEAVKGIRQLLEVFVNSAGELGTLVIAGAGGDLEGEVQDAAAASDAVEYLGRISRERVMSELRRSRAALVPSLWDENNPMSLLEARAAGIPVVATAVGGLSEMVEDGVDGFLVPPGDIQALRAAVAALAQSPELAMSFATAGLARFARVNSESVHYGQLMAAYALAKDVARQRSAS
jgi:glycosyltransferase involved in cell wall biosynthesis